MKNISLSILLTLVAALSSAQNNSAGVQGVVTLRETGGPLFNARVTLASRWFAPRSSVQLFAFTDEQGRFSISDVAPGQYLVNAIHEQYVSPRDGYGYVTVKAGETLRNLSIVMSSGAVIAGTLTDAAGKGVANARIEAFSDESHVLGGAAATNDRGQFRLSNLPPGKYIVRAGTTDSYARVFFPGVTDIAKAALIDVGQAFQANNTNFVLQAGPLFKASGRLIVDFAPADTAIDSALYLFAEISPDAPDEYFSPKVSRGPSDPRTGYREFEFSGLQPGPHILMMTVRDAQNLTHTSTKRIEVGTQDLALGTLHLGAGVDVKAKVVAPAGDFSVTALTCDLRPDLRMALTLRANPINTHQAKTDASGNCTVPRMGDGTYSTVLLGLPAGMILANMQRNGRSLTQRSIAIEGKSPEPIDLILSKSGSVQGTIRKSDKSPAAARVFFLYQGTSPLASSRAETTDETGYFELQGFVPGDYTFFALESTNATRTPDAAGRAGYAAAGRRITIGPGERLNLEGVLLPR